MGIPSCSTFSVDKHLFFDTSKKPLQNGGCFKDNPASKLGETVTFQGLCHVKLLGGWLSMKKTTISHRGNPNGKVQATDIWQSSIFSPFTFAEASTASANA